MFGKTNSKSTVDPSELINITLSTNQSDHSDLIGISFVVICESFEKEYTWKGNEITIKIPAGEQYTVLFNEIAGYKSPESVTYTAVEANARDIEALYQTELLTVNVSADEGEVSGFEVSIRGSKLLDSEYTVLEYIEATGSQYIDTGFKPNQDTRVVVNMYLTQNNSDVAANEFFGARTSTSSKCFAVQYNNTSGRLQYFYGNGYTQLDNDFPGTKTVYDANKNILYSNESEVIERSYVNFQCDYNLYLFALNNAGSVSFQSYARLYSCQIYDNGTLIRDYAPVKSSTGVVGLYDKLNGTFYPSDSATSFVAGAELTETIATQTTAVATHKIPFGMKYIVLASRVDRFATPASKSYTSGQQSRSVEMMYETLKFGVFVQGVSGALYTNDTWSGQETPNGIAVITDQCSFVIGLNAVTSEWGADGVVATGAFIAKDSNTAETDCAGEANTTAIISELSGYSDAYVTGAPAAEYCRNYTFPNGQNGYLGAAGEWQVVIDNKPAIEALLARCAGKQMDDDSYWSSTQYDMDESWCAVMNDMYLFITFDAKSFSFYARPFCSI